MQPIPKEWDTVSDDPRDYGERVFNWLFADGSEIRRGFLQARWDSESLERSVPAAGRIRLRLNLDTDVPDLQKIWWEAMYDPTRKLFLGLQMPISRFVKSGLRRLWPVSERPLRMLGIVSNPTGLESFDCMPMDVPVEKQLVLDAISDVGNLIDWRPLAPAPTLEQVRSAMAETRPHIVYILAHSVHDSAGKSSLLFSGADSRPEQLPFEDFARLIAPPNSEAPYLVFLALPQKARIESQNTLAPLGQTLVEAGVQAVLAIHAPLPQSDLLQFTKIFFENLVRKGVVDMAVMSARQQIFREKDWAWTYPVLYLRAQDAILFQPLSTALQAKLSSLAEKLHQR